MSEEQLYGREATEAAHGYEPLPPAVPTDESASELEHAEAIIRLNDDRAQEVKPIIERQYMQLNDEGAGVRKQPDNRTVELERAAQDLTENRLAEAAVAEMDRNLALAAEIDAARGLQSQPGDGTGVREHPLNQQQQAEPVEARQQQAEPPQPEAAPTDGVDPEVRAALQNPKVMAAVQQERAAYMAAGQAAFDNATAWAKQNLEVAAAAIFTRPELAGVAPNQLPGAMAAIAKTNPALHAEIQGQMQRVSVLAQQAQQASVAQQQRQAAMFEAYAKAQDDLWNKSVANESPESLRAVGEQARQILRDSGLSDQEISYHWQTNPLMRSALGQQILADAARWRMAKAGIADKVARPVVPVQKPGSGLDRPDAANRDLFALEARYQGPLTAKQAAELVIGRRARAR